MSEQQKIYFAGSIRGGRDDVRLYAELVRFLSGYGEVLTAHVGDLALDAAGDEGISEEAIYHRDMAWLDQADWVIAEVTSPSLGVGYELASAERRGKPVLCLFRPDQGKTLSAMIAGNPAFCVQTYLEVDGAKAHIADFLGG